MTRASYHKRRPSRKNPTPAQVDRQARCSRHRQCLALTCPKCERRKRRGLIEDIYHAWIHTYGYGWAMLITMTYLPDSSMTPGTWLDLHRRHWDALRKRWERERGGVMPAVWSLQWTALNTPHKHLAVPMVKGVNLVELRMWLSKAWAEIAGDRVGDVHIAVGKGPDNIRGIIKYTLRDVRETGPDLDAGQNLVDENMDPGPKSPTAGAVTPIALDGLITNDVMAALETTLRDSYRPRPEGLPQYRRWGRMGGMPRGIIRRRREFVAQDGGVFNWHDYRRLTRKVAYWRDKAAFWKEVAVDHPGSSRATGEALASSATLQSWVGELSAMRELRPTLGGWREQGDALDERVMQMESGELVALYQNPYAEEQAA